MRDDDGLLAIADGCGPYPVRGGNRVIPWIDGVPFYRRLAAAACAARARVWAVVSFIEPAFCLPDGLAWWDLLDRCRARGLDVRVLFWRNPRFSSTRHVFLGGPAEREFLAARGAAWAARWDSSAEPDHCHHQKAFVVDAGEPDAVAFVGGMVLSNSTLAHPGHHRGLHKHDAFLELQGPVVADAEHNFVQRWNFARRDPAAPPWPDDLRAGPLPWPERLPPERGDVRVQLARTIAPGCYRGPTPIVGAGPCDSEAGEAGVLAHYLAAIAAARRTIYIENQHPAACCAAAPSSAAATPSTPPPTAGARRSPAACDQASFTTCPSEHYFKDMLIQTCAYRHVLRVIHAPPLTAATPPPATTGPCASSAPAPR